MFILLISRGIPSKKHPQWGCFEKDQAEALAAIGHKVVVASVDSRFLWEWRKLGVTKKFTNNVTYYNSFVIPGSITRVFGRQFNLDVKQWQMKNLYNQILKEQGKPDIIYGHFSFITANAVKIALENKIPLVGMEHDAIFNKEKLTPYISWISKYVYHNTNLIISVSQNLKDNIIKHLGKDSIVVHNTINKEFINAPCATSYTDQIKFVAMGSLVYRKGYDLLIRAFQELDLPKDSWTLTIIGNGEEKENLMRLIHNATLQDNIILVGQKNKKEIIHILSRSKIFLMPSRGENFSVAILEALACGLPVVTSDCGGARVCISDINGRIFPIDDIPALKTIIQKIYNKEITFDNQLIAQNCRDNYAPEVIAKKLTTIFEQVINDYENHTTH